MKTLLGFRETGSIMRPQTTATSGFPKYARHDPRRRIFLPSMASYLIRRIWQMIPTLAGVILLVFFLFKYFGGDPAEILAGLKASPQQIASLRQQLGLDQPVADQLWIFVRKVLVFDWGRSWTTNEEISNIFRTRLPATLTIMVPILVLDVVLGTICGMAVAYVRGSLTDRAVMVITTLALSISFLVYVIVAQYVFAFRLGWFPVQGWSDSFWTNFTVFTPLPVLLAVLVGLAPSTRLYRTFFLDEMGHDYVRTARAKGVPENTHPLQARAAQRADPDTDQRRDEPARHLHRLVPAGDLLFGAGARAGGLQRRQPQRLPRDTGRDDLPRGAHDGDQPAH